MIRLGDVEIPADLFVQTGMRAGTDEVAFDYRHETTGIRARVRYWIEGEDPWFRKQLTLDAPDSPGAPTPDRLWVDLQENPPRPMRRVGYSVRGGPDAEEQTGLDSYAPPVPGCGYPVWAGDWFAGLEHPVGFTVPGDRLELFHHPVWDDERRIESYTAVYGAAERHERCGTRSWTTCGRSGCPGFPNPSSIFRWDGRCVIWEIGSISTRSK